MGIHGASREHSKSKTRENALEVQNWPKR